MIGKVLGNRYEIVEKIGGGGMAIVYKAKCNLLNRFVAVKILRSEFTNDKDLIDKFKRESQAAASLSHPNIVNIYDVGEDEDIYYIVMEYVAGKTLKELIKEKGSLEFSEIVDFSKQIAYALRHAHHNHIVHRDIKPHNILVTKDHRAKVTDFGIALAATSSTITNAGSVIGSVHYFSPEQARGGYTDEKSDLYSLGIVMYEMATGRVPFEGESPITVALKHIQEKPVSPADHNPELPKGLTAIILKLMQKEQSSRIQNTEELLIELNQLKKDPHGHSFGERLSEEDSPTQVIPIISEKDLEEIDKDAEKPAQRKKTKVKKSIVVLAVLSALIAALLFTFGFFYVSNLFRNNDVVVPQFVELHKDEAAELADSLKLQIQWQTKNSTEVPEDYVMEQRTAEGMTVREGTSITLVVSLGARGVEVPDLVFQNEIDVPFLLRDAKLEPGDKNYEYSDLAIGTVIRQNPKAALQAPEGSKVDYWVSQGPEITTFLMPNLIGRELSEAEAVLEQVNLNRGEVTREYSNQYAEGLVIDQSVQSRTVVEENTTINLVVSRGPEPIPVPVEPEPPGGENNGNNGPANEASGNSSMREINVVLTGQSGVVNIDLYQVFPSGKQIIHSKAHDISKEGTTAIFRITGSGTQTFEVYVEGKPSGSQIRIDF